MIKLKDERKGKLEKDARDGMDQVVHVTGLQTRAGMRVIVWGTGTGRV
jgi:hypothetical protein